MTQPPGQPPYDGYGSQPPQQPPYPGPYTPPPAAPGGQPPNPYATGPQQPYAGGGQPPYGGAPGAPGMPGMPGAPNYGPQYGGYPPPPPPSGSNGGKIALIVVAAVAAIAVLGGGIFLLTGDGDEGGTAKPRQSVSAQATESESPTEEATDAYSPTPDESDPAGDSTGTPPDKGVEGQWQDDQARTLTIGEEQSTGELKGQHALSYIDMVGGKGLLNGVGAYRDDNNFRMALKPFASKDVSDEDIIFGTVRRDGDEVTITWEDGGDTVTLAYVGEASS
ncbi:hypothetical protein [Streptomyces capitiformicae]|uniref:Uncharacterized protein n=1 Tax=Streptomyces capitiformicae TaxID=2014920 RepID=A0A918ZIJ9_9ACTN|nr:hypothetical protein [Streptomyces capitiformicae]GHE51890.1 hypothetical protein GCM10017771_74070 [Streptomyces capitiformicae]